MAQGQAAGKRDRTQPARRERYQNSAYARGVHLTRNPDKTSLTATGFFTSVGKKLFVAGGRAQIKPINMARPQTGCDKLVSCQAPEVHCA
jgi:hypothetical protein